MRNRPVAAAILAGALVGLLLVGCADGARDPVLADGTAAPEQNAEIYEAELVELTNAARTAEGIDPLEASACARTAALERAAALVGRDELTHAPLAPVIENCAPVTTAAENLVNSRAEAVDVVDAWLGSPGHRANIVDPALTHIGIGCVPDGAKMLCAQIFLGP